MAVVSHAARRPAWPRVSAMVAVAAGWVTGKVLGVLPTVPGFAGAAALDQEVAMPAVTVAHSYANGNGQTVTRMDLWRGPSGFDVKHRFVLSYVWDLPFGNGRRWASSGLGDAVLGNWQFSGIVTLATGRPCSSTVIRDVLSCLFKRGGSGNDE